MDYKTQAHERLSALGVAPECFGRYRPDVAECIDDCVWLYACPVYRDHCRDGLADPLTLRETMDASAFQDLVIKLFAKALANKKVSGSRPVARRGWQRYLDALQEALGFEIFSDEGFAENGDLYIKSWRGKNPHIALVYNVRAKFPGTVRADRVFTRYHPNKLTRLQPIIELRCHPDTIFKHYPHALALASRWRLEYMITRPIGAVAINVLPDKIEDMARLNVRLLEDGLIRGLELSGRKFRKVRKQKR